jgi:hypothetical protein
MINIKVTGHNRNFNLAAVARILHEHLAMDPDEITDIAWFALNNRINYIAVLKREDAQRLSEDLVKAGVYVSIEN